MESSPGWGGQEIRIWEESKGLQKKGHKLYFICEKGSPLADHARQQGFPLLEVNFKKRKAFTLFWQCYRFLKKEGIQVINTHSSLDSWIGGIAGRLLGIPIVRTRHLSTPVKKGLNSLLLYNKLTDFVVTTCSEIIPSLSLQSRKELRYFKCIATGVDEKKALQDHNVKAFRKKYHIPENVILVGMVCFMRSWKGVDDFIEAAAMTQKDPSIQWIMIGGGHSEKYRKKVQKKGLKNFIFTGHLTDPLQAIAALDVFCLLSTGHEGISQASLQAALLKKPLVTTSTGGLKEVCLPDKTGIIVPKHAPDKVCEAVKLLKDATLRRFYGDNGHELVLSKFTFEQTLTQMEKVFTELV
jgi:glycosyltransferase involved in cell wall biosynthesis